jgi:hypothetical protein
MILAYTLLIQKSRSDIVLTQGIPRVIHRLRKRSLQSYIVRTTIVDNSQLKVKLSQFASQRKGLKKRSDLTGLKRIQYVCKRGISLLVFLPRLIPSLLIWDSLWRSQIGAARGYKR